MPCGVLWAVSVKDSQWFPKTLAVPKMQCELQWSCVVWQGCSWCEYPRKCDERIVTECRIVPDIHQSLHQGNLHHQSGLGRLWVKAYHDCIQPHIRDHSENLCLLMPWKEERRNVCCTGKHNPASCRSSPWNKCRKCSRNQQCNNGIDATWWSRRWCSPVTVSWRNWVCSCLWISKDPRANHSTKNPTQSNVDPAEHCSESTEILCSKHVFPWKHSHDQLSLPCIINNERNCARTWKKIGEKEWTVMTDKHFILQFSVIQTNILFCSFLWYRRPKAAYFLLHFCDMTQTFLWNVELLMNFDIKHVQKKNFLGHKTNQIKHLISCKKWISDEAGQSVSCTRP